MNVIDLVYVIHFVSKGILSPFWIWENIDPKMYLMLLTDLIDWEDGHTFILLGEEV